MNLEYVRVESTVEPQELETGVTTVYLRKDIAREERTTEQGETYAIWTYQEAKLSHDEFNNYIKLVQARNALNGVNDSGNIAKLLEGQMTGDDYQFAIMSALTDLYELLS